MMKRYREFFSAQFGSSPPFTSLPGVFAAECKFTLRIERRSSRCAPAWQFLRNITGNQPAISTGAALRMNLLLIVWPSIYCLAAIGNAWPWKGVYPGATYRTAGSRTNQTSASAAGIISCIKHENRLGRGRCRDCRRVYPWHDLHRCLVYRPTKKPPYLFCQRSQCELVARSHFHCGDRNKHRDV